MTRHKIEYIDIRDLIPADRNSKAHEDALISASFERFGFIESIVRDDRTGKIIAGHGRHDRLIAAQDAGDAAPEGVVVQDARWLAPVETGWSSKDDDEALAAGIALNRIGEKGGWNWQLLLPDLERLDGIDALPLGFSVGELGDLRNMLGNLDSLDGERRNQGEPGDRDFWPVLRLQVSKETKAKWDEWVAAYDGDDEDAIVAALLDYWKQTT